MERRTAKTIRAIAFRVTDDSLEVVELITRRLQQIHRGIRITLTPLNGTYYAETFPTVRSQRRACGVLRGFVQVDQTSIQVMTIKEVNEIFNAHRQKQERSLFPLPA